MQKGNEPAEVIETQKRVFTKWMHQRLVEIGRSESVPDIIQEFRSGEILLILLGSLKGLAFTPEKGKARQNVHHALEFLRDQYNIPFGTEAEKEIADGDEESILGLIWTVIRVWYMDRLSQMESCKDKEITLDNLEAELLSWCDHTTCEYLGVTVKNFTTSWRDGMALLALIHSYRSDLFHFESRFSKTGVQNVSLALHLASEVFSIDRILEPEDISDDQIDKKCVMTYIMMLHETLEQPDSSTSSAPSLDASTNSLSSDVELEPQAASDTFASFPVAEEVDSFESYRDKLENMLTWLLEAEERFEQNRLELESQSTQAGPALEMLAFMRTVFEKNEEYTTSLAEKQEELAWTLQLGSRLLDSGKLSTDEAEQVRRETSLLNTRWNQLGLKVEEHETAAQERLGLAQDVLIKEVTAFLGEMEGKISQPHHMGSDIRRLKEQLEWTRSLEAVFTEKEALLQELEEMIQEDMEEDADMDVGSPPRRSDSEHFRQRKSTSASDQVVDELVARWRGLVEVVHRRGSQLQAALLAWREFEDEEAALLEWMSDVENALQRTRSQRVAEVERQAAQFEEEWKSRYHKMQVCGDRIQELCDKSQDVGVSVENRLHLLLGQWKCLLGSSLETGEGRSRKRRADSPQDLLDSTDARALLPEKQLVETDLRELDAGTPTYRKEFESMVEQLMQWLDTAEEQMELTNLKLDDLEGEGVPGEFTEMLNFVADDMRSWRDRLVRMRTLGHRYRADDVQAGENVEEIDQVFEEMDDRWTALETLYEGVEAHVTCIETNKEFYVEVFSVKNEIASYMAWLEANSSEVEDNEKVIRGLLQAINERKESMQEVVSRVQGLTSHVTSLLSPEAADEVHLMKEDCEKLLSMLTKVKAAYGKCQEDLEESLKHFSSVQEAQQLVTWLEEVDRLLKQEAVYINDFDGLKEQKDRYSKFQEDLDKNCKTYEAVLSLDEGSDGTYSELIANIKIQWQNIAGKLEKRVPFLSDLYEKLSNILTQMESMENWLDSVYEKVDILDQVPVATVEEAETHAKELTASLSEINTLTPTLESLTASLKIIEAYFSAKYKADLKLRLESLTSFLDTVKAALHDSVTRLVERQVELKTAGPGAEGPVEGENFHATDVGSTEEMLTWVGHVQTELESYRQIGTEGELTQFEDRLMALSQEGQLFLSSLSKIPSSEESENLNKTLTDIHHTVEVEKERCKAAKYHLDDFQSVLSEEEAWISEVQKAIAESKSRTYGDAEELSEDIDELEKVLSEHSEDDHQRLSDLKDSLIEAKVMGDSVAASFASYAIKYEDAKRELEELLDKLQSSLSTSQSTERQVGEMSQWLDEVTQLLKLRLDADFVGEDVPDEFDTVKREFAEYEVFLRELKEHADRYRAAHNKEAADRVELHYKNLTDSFTPARALFMKYSRPADFEPRMTRVKREMERIHEQVYLLDIINFDPDAVAHAKGMCQRFIEILVTIKPDLDYITETGKVLALKKQIEFPARVVSQLEHLSKRYVELNTQLSETSKNLEEGYPLVVEINNYRTKVEDTLDEKEADWDGLDNDMSSMDKMEWIKTTLEVLRPLKDALTKMKEVCNRLRPYMDVTELVDEVFEDVEELCRRTDSVIEEFETRLEDIEGHSATEEIQDQTESEEEQLLEDVELEDALSGSVEEDVSEPAVDFVAIEQDNLTSAPAPVAFVEPIVVPQEETSPEATLQESREVVDMDKVEITPQSILQESREVVDMDKVEEDEVDHVEGLLEAMSDTLAWLEEKRKCLTLPSSLESVHQLKAILEKIKTVEDLLSGSNAKIQSLFREADKILSDNRTPESDIYLVQELTDRLNHSWNSFLIEISEMQLLLSNQARMWEALDRSSGSLLKWLAEVKQQLVGGAVEEAKMAEILRDLNSGSRSKSRQLESLHRDYRMFVEQLRNMGLRDPDSLAANVKKLIQEWERVTGQLNTRTPPLLNETALKSANGSVPRQDSVTSEESRRVHDQIMGLVDWLNSMSQILSNLTVRLQDEPGQESNRGSLYEGDIGGYPLPYVTQIIQRYQTDMEGKAATLDVILGHKERLPAMQEKIEAAESQWKQTDQYLQRRVTQLNKMSAQVEDLASLDEQLDAWIGQYKEQMDSLQVAMKESTWSDKSKMMLSHKLKILKGEIPGGQSLLDEYQALSCQIAEEYVSDNVTLVKGNLEEMNQRWATLMMQISDLSRGLSSTPSEQMTSSPLLSELSILGQRLDAMERESPIKNVSEQARSLQIRNLTDIQSEIIRLENAARSSAQLSGPDMGREVNARLNNFKDRAIQMRSLIERVPQSIEDFQMRLQEVSAWLREKDVQLRESELNIGGDVPVVRRQFDNHQLFLTDLNNNQAYIEDTLNRAKRFISAGLINGTGDSDRSVSSSLQRIGEKLQTSSHLLWKQYSDISVRSRTYHDKLRLVLQKLEEFESRQLDIHQGLMRLEGEVTKLVPLTHLAQDKYPQDIDHCHALGLLCDAVFSQLDNLDWQAGQLKTFDVRLSNGTLSRLQEAKTRLGRQQNALNERLNRMNDAARKVANVVPPVNGLPADDCLYNSVSTPWERCLQPTGVPFYKNHATQVTQWDHPEMAETMKILQNYNSIKFAAYRTGIKLRALQRKLCLDLVDLVSATSAFRRHDLHEVSNTANVDVRSVVACLVSMFDAIDTNPHDVDRDKSSSVGCGGRRASMRRHHHHRNKGMFPRQPIDGDIRGNKEAMIPMCADLALNWLLNMYDVERSGKLCLLSFKVAIILLCSATLEEKYRYLFETLSPQEGRIDQRQLTQLLSKTIQIPQLLGEGASFGGSNVEPSVRSCFTRGNEEVPYIGQIMFLSWLKMEPQSLVWLPVFHRLAISETAVHHSKCSVCKISPIMGLRCRCLRCFNFDLCQNCFLMGKLAKSHKLTHPMQEYCTNSTSGQNFRDFSRTLRNRMRTKGSFRKMTRSGYLPVQSVNERDRMQSSPTNNTRPFVPESRYVPAENTSPPHHLRESIGDEEHSLIAHYSENLRRQSSERLQSPLQIMRSVTSPMDPRMTSSSSFSSYRGQAVTVQDLISSLEEENRALQAEFMKLRHRASSGPIVQGESQYNQVQRTGSLGRSDNAYALGSRDELLAEAGAYKRHKAKLESRVQLLEDHNRQLEQQLSRLNLLLSSNPAVQLSPATGVVSEGDLFTSHQYVNTRQTEMDQLRSKNEANFFSYNTLPNYIQPVVTPQPNGNRSIVNLFHQAGQVGKAVGQLVAVMSDESVSIQQTRTL